MRFIEEQLIPGIKRIDIVNIESSKYLMTNMSITPLSKVPISSSLFTQSRKKEARKAQVTKIFEIWFKNNLVCSILLRNNILRLQALGYPFKRRPEAYDSNIKL